MRFRSVFQASERDCNQISLRITFSSERFLGNIALSALSHSVPEKEAALCILYHDECKLIRLKGETPFQDHAMLVRANCHGTPEKLLILITMPL